MITGVNILNDLTKGKLATQIFFQSVAATI